LASRDIAIFRVDLRYVAGDAEADPQLFPTSPDSRLPSALPRHLDKLFFFGQIHWNINLTLTVYIQRKVNYVLYQRQAKDFSLYAVLARFMNTLAYNLKLNKI
jgi:hypothetical protein